MILLPTAAQMRELDRLAIEQLGIPGVVLMESAGVGVADAVVRQLGGSVAGIPIGLVCGGGNNGGDGCVAARHLLGRGADVRVYLVGDKAKIRGDARTHLEILERMGVALRALPEEFSEERVLVDALLGTGLKANVEGALGQAIARINRAKAFRLSIDIPSGLDADTGRPHGSCVRADRTVTMALPKIGLVSSPGFEFVGELSIVDIGIPPSLVEKQGIATSLLEQADVEPLVPERPRGAHKGTFGHLLVVAGSRGKTGAALLCGEAALRSGTGLVTLASRPETERVLAGRVRELMTGLLEGEADLPGLLGGKRAVCLGPGIPTDDSMRALVRKLAVEAALPMVIDADGLNALAGSLGLLVGSKGPRLLTPHPGEAGRLLGVDTGEVQADRIKAARDLAARSGAIVALKGARTVVATPDGQAFINPTGNPGLASGGTGDVLTGLCGGLLAQGVAPLSALLLAVYAHGRAADLVVAKRGTERGLLAREVISAIPQALRF